MPTPGPSEEPDATPAPAGELEIPEGELALGFNMVANLAFGHSGSANATAEADGLAQANVDIYAVTLNSEGVIVDCKIDAIQCKVNFDAAGQLVTEVGTEFLSKMELKDDYAMRSASGIGAEWFEQVEALEEYCIGKTPAEVAGIALDDAGQGGGRRPDRGHHDAAWRLHRRRSGRVREGARERREGGRHPVHALRERDERLQQVRER